MDTSVAASDCEGQVVLIRLTWDVPIVIDPPGGVGRLFWSCEQPWAGAHVLCSEGREGTDIVHTSSGGNG